MDRAPAGRRDADRGSAKYNRRFDLSSESAAGYRVGARRGDCLQRLQVFISHESRRGEVLLAASPLPLATKSRDQLSTGSVQRVTRYRRTTAGESARVHPANA